MIEPAAIHSTVWNQLIAGLPGSHVLQTWHWGMFKSLHGWEPIYCIWTGAGNDIRLVHTFPKGKEAIRGAALVLKRGVSLSRIKLPFNILYVPKGPLLLDWNDAVLRQQILDDLRAFARMNKSISIKIDPDIIVGYGEPGSPGDNEIPLGRVVEGHLRDNRWHASEEQIQFRNTVLLDINQSEDAILAGMKQKTRYNIRLASRKGVTVRKGELEDLELLYQMYAETALRDNFIIREREYYLKAWRIFMDSHMAQPLIAQVDGQPVAALILFLFSGKAWYMYGMSGEVHREKMPNYLLQWEAIRHAKSSGCIVYDMWGAPDRFDESDPMWGVYRFKEGFGGQLARTIGAWDRPVRPALYQFYTAIMPRILEAMRRRSKAKREHALED